MRRVLRILRRVERMTWRYPPQLIPVLAVLVQCVAAVQFATLLLADPSIAAAAEPVQGAGTVSGQALWAEGIPSAGTRISAIVVTPPNPANRAWLAGEKVAASTVTDGDGRYRIEALAPGRYHIVSGPVNLPRFFSDVAMAANPHVVTVAAGTVVNNVDFTIVRTTAGFPYVPGKLLTVTGKLSMKTFGSAGGGIYLLVQNSDGSTTRWYVRRVQMPAKFWWPGYGMEDIQYMVNAGETVTYTGTEIPNWGTNNAALAGTRAIDPVEATRGGQ